MESIQKIKTTALKITMKAGEILLRNYGRVRRITHKGAHSINLVTDIDQKSENFIVTNLLKAFPNSSQTSRRNARRRYEPHPFRRFAIASRFLDPRGG